MLTNVGSGSGGAPLAAAPAAGGAAAGGAAPAEEKKEEKKEEEKEESDGEYHFDIENWRLVLIILHHSFLQMIWVSVYSTKSQHSHYQQHIIQSTSTTSLYHDIDCVLLMISHRRGDRLLMNSIFEKLRLRCGPRCYDSPYLLVQHTLKSATQ